MSFWNWLFPTDTKTVVEAEKNLISSLPLEKILDNNGMTVEWIVECLSKANLHQTYNVAFGGKFPVEVQTPQAMLILLVLALAKRVQELSVKHTPPVALG